MLAAKFCRPEQNACTEEEEKGWIRSESATHNSRFCEGSWTRCSQQADLNHDLNAQGFFLEFYLLNFFVLFIYFVSSEQAKHRIHLLLYKYLLFIVVKNDNDSHRMEKIIYTLKICERENREQRMANGRERAVLMRRNLFDFFREGW